MMKKPEVWPRIVFFDGHCMLCNRSVVFLLQNDPHGRLRFASLQSGIARELLPDGTPPGSGQPDSIIYLEEGRIYTRSTAVLKIAAQLRQPWRSFRLLSVLPLGFRDWLYDFIARNRYRWFGRLDQCLVTGNRFKDRILE